MSVNVGLCWVFDSSSVQSVLSSYLSCMLACVPVIDPVFWCFLVLLNRALYCGLNVVKDV